MFNIGPLELIVILVVALLVVGPTRLPEVGRSIGRGLREFRKAQEEVQRTLRLSLDDDGPPSRPMQAAGAAPQPRAAAAEEAPDTRPREGPPETPPEPAPQERGGADDVARALGRGLAELRRAKEELQNSFRLDLGDGDGDDHGSRTG